jgi:hypothetical protein
MNEWGATNFKSSPNFQVTMFDVIKDFSPSLKQAMYAAANKGIIRRRTWDNCGLNAAGKELNIGGIESIETAAKAFGVSQAIAQKFIDIWDAMPGSDEECTEWLKQEILTVGLFTTPLDVLPRIIRRKTFVAQTTEEQEFEKLMNDNQVFGTELAEQILCGANA